jgi:hypothetical protein
VKDSQFAHLYEKEPRILSTSDDLSINYAKKGSVVEEVPKHKRRRRIKELLKKTFAKLGLKLRRVRDKIDSGLSKLSEKERKLHDRMVAKINHGYKIVARKLSQVQHGIAVLLEPILGERIVFWADKKVGSMIIFTQKLGKFFIDHFALICGFAVGILVASAVTAGLTAITLNPVLAGAIGGAVGAVANSLTLHIVGAAMRGNLVPTSLDELAMRAKRMGKELGAAILIGGAAGAISAGIVGAIHIPTGAAHTAATAPVKAGAGIGRAVGMGQVRGALAEGGQAVVKETGEGAAIVGAVIGGTPIRQIHVPKELERSK